MKHVTTFAIVLTILLTGICVTENAYSENNFGLGVFGGAPSGITGKLWLDDNHAIDGTVSWWSGFGNTVIWTHADYLVHMDVLTEALNISQGRLPFYFGVGGGYISAEFTSAVMARAPIGISYIFPNNKVEVFLEMAPTYIFWDISGFGATGGLGVRYNF